MPNFYLLMPLLVKNITIESACAMLSAPLLQKISLLPHSFVMHLSVQNTLTADDATLNMAEINYAYLLI